MKRSWKTSLAGIFGGFLMLVGPGIGARLQGDPTAPPITGGNLAPAIAVAVLGLLAKDSDVTGGKRPQ